MGRIFEVRKSTMFARWDRMAKQFTRIGKEIAIAVKSGGPEPATNPALRRCMQNAKAVNMPKDRVEAAIKRALGNSNSVSFQFKKMGAFRLNPQGLNSEDLELELIDFGLEELGEGTGENGEEVLVVRCGFTDFGNMQNALEEKGINPISAELEWVPTTTVSLPEDQAEDVFKLVDKLEQDEDVQKVFHNLQ